MSRFPSLPNTFWVVMGAASLVTGVIGLFLPLLPTTPFVLFAAYCFSRGSPRYHSWLLSHPLFGQMIRDWHDGHVIRRRTKVLSTITGATMVAIPVAFLDIPLWTKLVMIIGTSGALVYVWLQKERRQSGA